jgi:hypothetical protein
MPQLPCRTPTNRTPPQPTPPYLSITAKTRHTAPNTTSAYQSMPHHNCLNLPNQFPPHHSQQCPAGPHLDCHTKTNLTKSHHSVPRPTPPGRIQSVPLHAETAAPFLSTQHRNKTYHNCQTITGTAGACPTVPHRNCLIILLNCLCVALPDPLDLR